MLLVLILYAILIALPELLEKQEANSEKLKMLLKELGENYNGTIGNVAPNATSSNSPQITVSGTFKRNYFLEEEKNVLAQGGLGMP